MVSSQLAAHGPYGGVVPEIAAREHLRNWTPVFEAACVEAGVAIGDVDVVAATRGPGLVGALLVGLSLGRAVAWSRALPFHGVHHLEGHLFSPFLQADGDPAEPIDEPFVGLVVSGGHTSLFGVAAQGTGVETLAETRDDAFGEAFDKLGKKLGLPYPQGPHLDAIAERGDAAACPLPLAASPGGELFFSYSGLKSQAILELAKRGGPSPAPPSDWPQALIDLCAGFRAAAVKQVLDRVARLHRRCPISLLAVSGGAAANRLLRWDLQTWCASEGVALRLVPLVFSGDNAAMIAYAALLRERRGERDDPRWMEAASRIPMELGPGRAARASVGGGRKNVGGDRPRGEHGPAAS